MGSEGATRAAGELQAAPGSVPPRCGLGGPCSRVVPAPTTELLPSSGASALRSSSLVTAYQLALTPEVNPLLCLPSGADLPSAPVDVTVAADRLEVNSGGSCEAAALPAGVRLAPSSCRGLRHLPGDGLHLRMRLSRPPPGAGKGGAGAGPWIKKKGLVCLGLPETGAF